jgi:hypothetical protein
MNSHAKWSVSATFLFMLAQVCFLPPAESRPKPEPRGTANQNIKQKPVTHLQRRVFKLDLSERVIDEMEYNWNSLTAQAEAAREMRGWRFTRVNSDSSFYRAGLRTGDLITEDFLTVLRSQDTTAHHLAYRIELILNHITR